MTTRTEVLALAAERPPLAARDLLLAYEEWWRRRGDRQAARFWDGAGREFAALAVENYDDAAAVRGAAAELDGAR